MLPSSLLRELIFALGLLRYAQAQRGGSVEQYALSEVVIQPNVDVVHLGLLRKRQDTPATPLKNNVPYTRTINAGENQVFFFAASELTSVLPSQTPYVPDLGKRDTSQLSDTEVKYELKRQANPKVYFNVDICSQPGAAAGSTPTAAPPGLNLYVSSDPSNKNPGPNYQGTHQNVAEPTTGGHAFYETGESGDTYIGVSAPSLNGYSGAWQYQISVSTAGYYTGFGLNSMVRFTDSDPTSAFFVTERLYNASNSSDPTRQQWLATGGPYGLFIYNSSDPFTAGVERSYCGLKQYAKAFSNVPNNSTTGSETGMKVFNSMSVYQQFYVPNLQSNTTYKAILGLTSRYSRDFNSDTLGGGGTLWPPVQFQTRFTDNCQLIYNLSFCDSVAYSVPTNRTINRADLTANYDSYTNQTLWMNFRNSLDQIPCNTSNDAKYSLARNCDDCASAYKNWVCAVSIPRCADVLSNANFLKIRNTDPQTNPQPSDSQWPNGTSFSSDDESFNNTWNSQARNSGLGSYINHTGPYKEVLPADSLCYNLVQSCPSILGFACPSGVQKDWAYCNSSATPGTQDGYPSCNVPGQYWTISAAASLLPPTWLVAFAITLGMGSLWM